MKGGMEKKNLKICLTLGLEKLITTEKYFNEHVNVVFNTRY